MSDPAGGESPRAVVIKGVGALSTLGLLAFGLAAVLYYLVGTKYVRPDEYGVKQVYLNLGGILGKMGIQSQVYGPGIHRELPGCERIYTFPKTVQVLTFKAEGTGAAESPRFVHYSNAANIQTSDGFQIGLDVSVIYRIADPLKTFRDYGPGRNYEANGLSQRTEPMLKASLGSLNPEDFFHSKLRVQKQEEARKALDQEFQDKGIRVDHVLIRFPHYNPVVQQKIEERNLQEQTKDLNIAEAAEAEAKARLTKVVELGKAAMSIVLTNGANYVTRKLAEMQKFDRIKRSEADKLKNFAEAEKNRLINEAYEGSGSERVVAIEMAEVLKGLETILIPAGEKNGFNPLDVDALVQTLQGKGPAPSGAPPPGGAKETALAKP